VLRSRLFSTRTKLAMLWEFLSPPEPLAPDEDESVGGFVTRHFNSELVERIADPLLAGIYGGDTSVLSARATLPTLVDYEHRHRSLIRGALAARNGPAGAPAPLFTSMRDGMQRIVEAITRQLPRETLRCSCAVERLELTEFGWRLIFGHESEIFDQVVLALPAHASATLLAGVPNASGVVEILEEFAYTSAVTVALTFKSADVSLPEGFGFLVPRSEGKRMLACTFVHKKFEHRAPEGTALLRIFLGGARDPQIIQSSEAEVVELVRRELREILRLNAEPQLVRVFKWRNAMAQYEVGHQLRIARLEMHVQKLSGLQLSGNAYQGIGIPDCVRIGRSATDAIIRRMRAQRASL
jgi:oxygen-dependent protoporphyrinogen oxidase